MPEKRIFAKAGHVCMMCGFKATTKNKYRELQDHLSRRHFHERIKASLPTRRPFMCPDPSCTVEGKDWQALMRHYTGKQVYILSARHDMNYGQVLYPTLVDELIKFTKLCLVFDQEMVRSNKVTNDQFGNIFFYKKKHNLSFSNITYDIIFFPQK